MSKGSPILKFRCPPELKAWLDERVTWSRAGRRKGELDMTGLILLLIREGRAKRERSRTWRPKAEQGQPRAES